MKCSLQSAHYGANRCQCSLTAVTVGKVSFIDELSLYKETTDIVKIKSIFKRKQQEKLATHRPILSRVKLQHIFFNFRKTAFRPQFNEDLSSRPITINLYGFRAHLPKYQPIRFFLQHLTTFF